VRCLAARFLVGAGFLFAWLPPDVRGCRLVLAREWHGRTGSVRRRRSRSRRDAVGALDRFRETSIVGRRVRGGVPLTLCLAASDWLLTFLPLRSRVRVPRAREAARRPTPQARTVPVFPAAIGLAVLPVSFHASRPARSRFPALRPRCGPALTGPRRQRWAARDPLLRRSFHAGGQPALVLVGGRLLCL